jgi:hypothetical protein
VTTSARPYWFFRIYTAAVGLIWNIDGFTSIATGRAPRLMFFMFPLIIPAIFMLLSAGAFRFPYSAFGPEARTPWPPGPPKEEVKRTGGRVGWASATVPFVMWAVFPEGLAFSIFGIGAGFVFASEMREVKSKLFGCRITHASREVRSPMYVPSRRICRAIDEIRSTETFN